MEVDNKCSPIILENYDWNILEQSSYNIIRVENQIKIGIWKSQFPIHDCCALFEPDSMSHPCEEKMLKLHQKVMKNKISTISIKPWII